MLNAHTEADSTFFIDLMLCLSKRESFILRLTFILVIVIHPVILLAFIFKLRAQKLIESAFSAATFETQITIFIKDFTEKIVPADTLSFIPLYFCLLLIFDLRSYHFCCLMLWIYT
jgi:hypothetical protein